MADQVQGVPPGLIEEPVQGVPPGLTAEPVQQAASQDQVQGVPPGLIEEPVEQPGAISRFGSGVAAGTSAMIPKQAPSTTDILLGGAVGPLYQVAKMPVSAYEEYKQARAEGQPVISSAAAGLGGVLGLDPEGIRERAAKGDVAGIIGEAVPSIALTVIGGEHERIAGALKGDAESLASATARHESAKAMFDQRMQEQHIATDQTIRATQDAQRTEADFKQGKATQQHVDDANTRASAAAANAKNASKALADAHETHAQTGAEVDRLQRKLQRSAAKVNVKQTQAAAGAYEDFKSAIPSPARGPAAYTDRDYEVGRRYLENHHENIQQIGSVQDAYDAFDYIQHDMENKIKPYIDRYSNDPIATNVKMDVRNQLAENPRADFTEKGMAELDKYNLTDPTISEADDIRNQLNAENRAILKKNMWDIATALQVDPEFAARYAAADSLRNGIYDTLGKDRGVTGVRELRQDEASIIKLRNAAERQLAKGEVKVRGSGKAGPIRKFAAKILPVSGAAVGAEAGAGLGHPVWGASIGEKIGEKLGKVVAPGDLTRDELIERSLKQKGAGVPMTEIKGPGLPPEQYGPPSAVSPRMQMYVPQRELTPLHSDLATHYGESVNDTSYVELEKRFMDDLNDKKRHGIQPETAEKTLLGKINQANAADALARQQQLQEMAAQGKTEPRPTLPEQVEPLLNPPSAKFAEGMDTHKGIVHDLAHIVVGNEHGIEFPDGIRSHLHPEVSQTGALMSAPINFEDFVDKQGNIDPAKIKPRMADIAATYVAGGVANDLYHDIPFTENHHLGADVRVLKSFMKSVGFTEAEASKMMLQAANDAAKILSQPGMQDMLEQHAAVREAGLDKNYHVSPERVEQILEDVKGITNETGKSTGTVRAGEQAGKGAGAEAEDESEERNPAKLSSETEGHAPGSNRTVEENAGRQSERTESKPNKPTSPQFAGNEESVDEDELLTSERQTPHKQSYPIEIINNQGGSQRVEVPAFSAKQALKTVEKQHPGNSYWLTSNEPNPIPAEHGYVIPDQKRLPMREGHDPLRTDDHVERHELGHAMLGMREGMEVNGMLRHTHPDMPRNSRAAIRWDTKNITDKSTGRFIPEKIPGLLRNLMGGIAADEVFNDFPRESNHNFNIRREGGDGNTAYKVLKHIGLNHDDAITAMNTAIDQAKQYLTTPAISDIINENVGKREPGLSRQYHYSPERLNQMHLEAQRRLNEPGQINNRATGAENAPGREGNVAAGTGQSATGAPEAVQAAQLTPRQIIEQQGLDYKGELVPGSGVHQFEDPEHPGMTAALKAPFTPDEVRAKMESKLAENPIVPKLQTAETDRVSTRVPTSAKSTENALEGEPLIVGKQAVANAPGYAQKIADKVGDYVGAKTPKNLKDPVKIVQHHIDRMADNLKWLYNQSTPEERTNNAKWYESANKLAKEAAAKHGISDRQAAGVIASLSPQKDWDQNVSLARRIMDFHANNQDFTATPEMINKGRDIVEKTTKNGVVANKALESVLDEIQGKKYNELTDPVQKAAFIRLYDETYNDRSYHKIDPGTGNNLNIVTNKDGSPTKVAWGSLDQIGHAISILDDGTRQNISDSLGGNHKVRNFYNNIIDPTNNQDVTIDTHAIAAGLLRPLAGQDQPVLDNFGTIKHAGTGLSGTYAANAEAYRQAAADLGIKPRELQSVTWEKIRQLFPDTFKTEANKKLIDKIWRSYDNGDVSLNQARQKILNLVNSKNEISAGISALGGNR